MNLNEERKCCQKIINEGKIKSFDFINLYGSKRQLETKAGSSKFGKTWVRWSKKEREQLKLLKSEMKVALLPILQNLKWF